MTDPKHIDAISVRGARTHNLQNVDVDIPRNRLVVITGVSGSGKSSLAFDTLLAEGQRQYVQSLSLYARQFLEQMEPPPVDRIVGLSPTIAIDQRPAARNPRSTVATLTDIYDYLRLLMARVGDVACPECGTPISQQTPVQIEQAISSLPEHTRAMLLAPLVRGRRGAHRDVIEAIQKAGLVRARVDGVVRAIEEIPPLAPQQSHEIEAVADRIVIREGIESRLAESVRLALRHGDGVVNVLYQTPESKAGDDWQERLFNTRYACPRCQAGIGEIEPRTFSFNSPYGACPTCQGLGTMGDSFTNGDGTNYDRKGATGSASASRAGAPGSASASRGPATAVPMTPDAAADADVCPACHGTRLRPEALACRLGGLNIHEITLLPVGEAIVFFGDVALDDERRAIAQPVLAEIVRRLEFLQRVGAEYLSLDRPADTLSGGERQRVRLATGIGSGLVGVLYLLDEPSIGLHPRDTELLIAALRDLERQGNTVVVVEHDEAMMRASDYLIDMGPGAGNCGGRIVAQGTPPDVADCEASVTGAYLSGRNRINVPARRQSATPTLELFGATANNLQNIDVTIPLGLFVCVTGVSGSGKSSLVVDTLARVLARRLNGAETRPAPHADLRGVELLDRLVEVDQSPIGRSPRSSAATYTGIWNDVRRVFAATRESRQRGHRVSRFSFNAKGGRCEDCRGAGVRRIAMKFLPDMVVTCPTCHGRRFNRQTLAVRYRGRSIADVLAMSVDAAAEFFVNHQSIHRLLVTLASVGLGYLPLGQPATTLSGGEAQRIKLAAELGRPAAGRTMYILDEPTAGLSTDDIRRLLDVLHRLVDQGNSVLVIEHNLDVMKTADWVIDLGPEGGAGGGHVVVAGTPEDVAACEASHTGRFLRPILLASG